MWKGVSRHKLTEADVGDVHNEPTGKPSSGRQVHKPTIEKILQRDFFREVNG